MAAGRIVLFALLSAFTSLALAGNEWRELSREQQRALSPLAGQWQSLDAGSRDRWLRMTDRFDQLTPEEQSRVQGRMRNWSSHARAPVPTSWRLMSRHQSQPRHHTKAAMTP
nr:DUF3106 domain-containing protein [Denitromonas sp.]